MATNVTTVFEYAMALTDNLDDSGKFDTSDNREYKNRTLAIINTLIGELYPYSDNFRVAEKGKRPIATPVMSFTDDIELDDYICRSVLPEGLVALLFADENPTLANIHMQIYEDRKRMLQQGLPAESEPIVDVYGGGYYGEEGNWHNGAFPYNNHSRWG